VGITEHEYCDGYLKPIKIIEAVETRDSFEQSSRDSKINIKDLIMN
jgi:hypothetical protein